MHIRKHKKATQTNANRLLDRVEESETSGRALNSSAVRMTGHGRTICQTNCVRRACGGRGGEGRGRGGACGRYRSPADEVVGAGLVDELPQLGQEGGHPLGRLGAGAHGGGSGGSGGGGGGGGGGAGRGAGGGEGGRGGARSPGERLRVGELEAGPQNHHKVRLAAPTFTSAEAEAGAEALSDASG